MGDEEEARTADIALLPAVGILVAFDKNILNVGRGGPGDPWASQPSSLSVPNCQCNEQGIMPM